MGADRETSSSGRADDRRAASRERQALLDEIERLRREGASLRAARLAQMNFAALGQLAHGAAHDFNNVLTVVLSALHLMRHAQDDERRERLLGRIGEAAERGARLTHRLLAFSRPRPLHPALFDLEAGLADLAELLSRSLRADLRIEAETEPGLWSVSVERGELEQALLNLAINSRDAMPHGGTILLQARNRALSGAAAERAGVAPGDYVELSVIDSGTGMAPEVQARVFEPFFTTKPADKACGLGLAQVYGFAQQSAGTAQVSSEPGEGCTVTLLLPALHPPAIHPTVAFASATDDEAADEIVASVLVVEDDFEVAALATDLLTQFGHTVTRVGGAEAALGVLSNGRPIDLVFTDVLLPDGGNGIDLAHVIGQRRPGLPIVLTTGCSGEAIGDRRIEWPILRKPYRPEDLRSVVAEALASRA